MSILTRHWISEKKQEISHLNQQMHRLRFERTTLKCKGALAELVQKLRDREGGEMCLLTYLSKVKWHKLLSWLIGTSQTNIAFWKKIYYHWNYYYIFNIPYIKASLTCKKKFLCLTAVKGRQAAIRYTSEGDGTRACFSSLSLCTQRKRKGKNLLLAYLSSRRTPVSLECCLSSLLLTFRIFIDSRITRQFLPKRKKNILRWKKTILSQ